MQFNPNRTVATSNVDTSANTIEITDHGFVANQEVVYKCKWWNCNRWSN